MNRERMLEEALQFYAEPKQYVPDGKHWTPPIDADKGERARAALSALSQDRGEAEAPGLNWKLSPEAHAQIDAIERAQVEGAIHVLAHSEQFIVGASNSQPAGVQPLPRFTCSWVGPGEMDYAEATFSFGAKDDAENFRRQLTELQSAHPQPTGGNVWRDAMLAAKAEARRYADFYGPNTDGRNTFILFADWCDTQASLPPAPSDPRPLDLGGRDE